MPLIIVTGYPSSGKTQRVNEIKEYLVKRLEEEKKTMRIHVINDESLHVTKDAYKGKALSIELACGIYKNLIQTQERRKRPEERYYQQLKDYCQRTTL
jgi:tRNA uridine 5-carbamoylmethylation protein Kti12